MNAIFKMKLLNTKFSILVFFILILSSCSSLIGIQTKSAKPNSHVPTKSIRYSTEGNITIKTLDIILLDDDLNLFKNNVLVRLKIEGKYAKQDFETKFFDEFLFVETAQNGGYSNDKEINIQVLPQYRSKQRRKDNTEYTIDSTRVGFQTTLEYRLYTDGFGMNKVTFHLGNQSKSIALQQKK